MASLFMDAYCIPVPPVKERKAVMDVLSLTRLKSYFSSVSPKKRVAVRSDEESKEVQRFPITQEKAADIVAHGLPEGMSGEGYPKEEYILDSLYHSISAMVYKLCRKYTATCTTELDDLAHDCLQRIFAKIYQFNSEKGKFTTWSYRVCLSVLARRYHNDKKRSDRFIDDGEDEEKNERMRDKGTRERGVSVLNTEMKEVVKGLMKDHPDKSDFIVELFGNIDSNDHLFPVSVCISDSARKLGIQYVEAYTFFKRVIRPVFKNYFELEEVKNV
jgi:DNA-directed RNA polymerase specialized sigma24 family protein